MRDKLGLAGDSLFEDQFDTARWPQRKRHIAKVIRAKTREQWCLLLEGTDVCFAPVLDPAEAPEHPHHKARQSFIRINDIAQPAPAPRLSRTPAAVRSPPAMPGEGANEALRDWGFTEGEVQRLRKAAALG
jgi:alpha-methylacyl-CoA racemase